MYTNRLVLARSNTNACVSVCGCASISIGVRYYTNSSITEGVNATNILQPKQMTKQVGGHPILVFHKYILKPLRLLSAGSSSHCNHDNNVINTKAKVSSDYKDGIKDKTKVYRGLREIAFYEALQYVSTSILSSENKISPHTSHDSSSADHFQQSSYTSFIQSII